MDARGLCALLGGDSAARAACRAAVEDGARVDDHGEGGKAVALTGLAVRARRRPPADVLGLDECLADLADWTGDVVVALTVDHTSETGYHFSVFLDGDRTRVVGCLGVRSW
ncbi:hypothetical protein ACFPM7_29875 [Actinokineospora guangxiensis]|uniref:Uncharacterized protein n=1 Tax=Actinokineospora guangxiensis TaxID=1490288 RepID=A0ABW0EVQ4_9PSEU